MKWVFAFNEEASGWFKEMIVAAVNSARKNTSLEPICLYSGKPNALTSWLEKKGVQVRFEKVPFYNEMFSQEVLDFHKSTHYSPHHASGAFLKAMASTFFKTEENLLITDCDVYFRKNPECKIENPSSFYAVNEVYLNKQGILEKADFFNSGIIFYNSKFFNSIVGKFVDAVKENRFYSSKTGSYDQTLMNRALHDWWTPAKATLNWRPFQGINQDAEIIHFHGPKPMRIKSILEGKASPEEEHLHKYILNYKKEYEHYVEEFFSYSGM